MKRFWNKVNRCGRQKCWVWNGYIDEWGYGRFRLNGRCRPAHRVAWEITNERKIPKGKLCCHSCDNPACCNPDHLWIGTQKQNVQDAVAKNRNARGERSGRAKLTQAEVDEIRDLEGSVPQIQIAIRYNVHKNTINHILRRKGWI